MVAAPLILGGDLKISDQNNWRGTEQKIKFGGRARSGFPQSWKILESPGI